MSAVQSFSANQPEENMVLRIVSGQDFIYNWSLGKGHRASAALSALLPKSHLSLGKSLPRGLCILSLSRQWGWGGGWGEGERLNLGNICTMPKALGTFTQTGGKQFSKLHLEGKDLC